MQTKILACYPDLEFQKENTSPLFLVDYTTQTNSQRQIELLTTKPKDIKSLEINNEANLNITFTSFKNTTFSQNQKTLSHCEGVMFPSSYNSLKSWLLFIELKYANSTSKNLPKAKEQLLYTIGYFRENNIISQNKKVHAIIAFPNLKRVPFENFILTPTELKELNKSFGVILRGVNKIDIISNQNLKV